MGTSEQGGLVTEAIVLVQHTWEKACMEGFDADEPFHAKLKPEGLHYAPLQVDSPVSHPEVVLQMVDSLLRSLANPAVWPYFAHKLARLYVGPMSTEQRIAAILARLMHAVEEVLQNHFTHRVHAAWQQVCDYVCACCCLSAYRESLYGGLDA